VRRLPLILMCAIVVAVPAVLLGNGLWVLTNAWYVHAEYGRPGFPDDRYGFTKAERTELALIGLRSIQPLETDGVAVLRGARLPDGGTAFTEQEVAHMADVRRLVSRVLLAWSIGLALVVAAGIAAWRLRLAGVITRGLIGGGVLTLAIAGAIGLIMLVDFDWFFVQFHEALFAGNSWLFPYSSTLIRLYPDAFWSDFGTVLAVLTILQAAALAGGLWWRQRRSRSPSTQAGAVALPAPSRHEVS
jgi:integral membrane protein (TIGR01906 family)